MLSAVFTDSSRLRVSMRAVISCACIAICSSVFRLAEARIASSMLSTAIDTTT